jgi:DNA-directed RNA polymerase specialized sigma subunit
MMFWEQKRFKFQVLIIKGVKSLTNKAMKERQIETHLRYYKTYIVGIKNCEKQLEYIMPNVTTKYGADQHGSFFYVVSDSTAMAALDRIEGKRAIDLREEIERYRIITETINNAFEELKDIEQNFVRFRYFECLPIHEVKQKLGYAEERAVYRIRRHTLDKLLISLNNLLSFQ